jgi:hypothetical protein
MHSIQGMQSKTTIGTFIVVLISNFIFIYLSIIKTQRPMVHNNAFKIIVLLFLFNFNNSIAQSTFTQIHQLLQTKCSGSGCHNGSTATFNVTLSESALYNALVNVNPVNPTAAAKGDKLIKPGYVGKSFLLRKISHSTNPYLALQQPHEGNAMPSGSAQLAANEIELIHQWILFGAPQSGIVVDTAMINMYYRGKGIDESNPNIAAPAAGTGFQIYLGKFFVPPATELEYFFKHDPQVAQHTEVHKLATIMPSSTHHFVIFKFFPGGAASYPEGLRPLTNGSHGETGDGIGSGPGYREFVLPTGTAYFWPANTILDLNLHIRNNNTDSVVAADLYVNFFTQPVGTASDYMLVRNFPVFTIEIPQDGQEHEFTEAAFDTTETKMWKIWMLYSHTHRYGTDYDIWLRNADGTKSNQLYEGFYNQEYQFNQGFYAWGVDVAIRYFTPFLEVDPRLGFIHRAKYINTNGPNPVYWGDTSLDEMMVMGFQYVYGDDLEPSSVQNKKTDNIRLNVFPNPASNMISLSYVLQQPTDVQVELFNILGEKTLLLNRQNKTAGNYLEEIELGNSFASGVYLLTFHAGNETITKRLVIE